MTQLDNLLSARRDRGVAKRGAAEGRLQKGGGGEAGGGYCHHPLAQGSPTSRLWPTTGPWSICSWAVHTVGWYVHACTEFNLHEGQAGMCAHAWAAQVVEVVHTSLMLVQVELHMHANLIPAWPGSPLPTPPPWPGCQDTNIGDCSYPLYGCAATPCSLKAWFPLTANPSPHDCFHW